MKFDIFSRDSFRLLVTVMRAGEPMNLSTASLEAFASRGGVGIPASIDVSGAAVGEIGLAFAVGALSVGNWDVHLRATMGTETQTVARATVVVSKAAEATP